MSSDHHDDHHHGPTHFWSKYIFSTDHKVIGIQFLFSSLLFVILGGALALGVRYQIAWPGQDLPYAEILPGTGPDGDRTKVIDEGFDKLDADNDSYITLEELATADTEEARNKAEKRISKLDKDQDNRISYAEFKSHKESPFMTTVTTEENLALWKEGNHVVVMNELADHNARGILASELPEGSESATRYPQGTKATIDKFTYGLAVELPKDIILQSKTGKKYTLAFAKNAFVEKIHVMGDYKPNSTMAIANKGTKLRLMNESQEPGEEVTLMGQVVYRQGPTGPLKDEESTVLLPILRTTTLISINIPEQEVVVKAAGADEAPTTIAVSQGYLESVGSENLKYNKHALTSAGYSTLFTMHASLMIFFVIIPALVGAFGNFLIPLMIGARDMAFPKLNALSFWLSFPSGIIMLASFWTTGGASGGGWTMYPTLSQAQFSSYVGTTLWLLSVFLVGFSSIVGSLNYITTSINMRSPGMSLFRMPLTVWSILITSILQVFATPMLAAAGILLVFDRLMGTHFFNDQSGGEPLLWQHLFWFYSHPAVYIMILPAMGIASDILAVFARKPIFGYKPMVYAMGGITGLGFIVWGHHMFQSGMNPILGTTFMATTIMIAVPSAIKVFNWLGTLWGGNIQFKTPMLFALGFVSMFTIGGLSGIFMACAPVDIQIHDTYFIVAHIHYVLFGGSIFGIFAGVYFWFPKMFGRQLDERWGLIHFILTIIAFNGTFFLMHNLGIGGHPRRYATQLLYPELLHLQPLNVIMTIFAMMLGTAQLPFFINIFLSLPQKLSRAVATSFLAGLGLPVVIGLSFWGVSDPGWFTTWFASHPVDGYTISQYWIGISAFWIGNAIIAIWMGRCYGIGIKITVLLSVAFIGWLNQYANFACVGYGYLYVVFLVVLLKGLWFIGNSIHLGRLIGKSLYLLALPAFMAPIIIKQDVYMWLGVPELFAYKQIILALFIIPGLVYLLIAKPSDAFGADPGKNPWMANSLEWAITSPPPFINFETIPTVHRGPYEYSSPASEEDYLPQTLVLPAGVVEPEAH